MNILYFHLNDIVFNNTTWKGINKAKIFIEVI